MAKIKFEVSAEVAKGIRGLLQVAAAEAKMSQAAEQAGRTATRAGREQEQAYQRAGRAADAAAAKMNRPTFRGGGYQVRRPDLATSQTLRAIGGGGSGGGSSNSLVQQAHELAVARQERAAYLRGERTRAEQVVRADRIRMIQSTFGGASPERLNALRVANDVREARDQRWDAAGGALAAAAGYRLAAGGMSPLGPGGDRHQRAAMRTVGDQLARLPPNLAARVTPDAHANWVAQEAARRRAKSQAIRTGAGAAAGAGVAGVALLNDVEQQRSARGDAMIEEADALRPLLSIGKNLQNADRVVAEVRAMAAAAGRPVSEVAAARYNVESAAGNFSAALTRDITAETMRLGQLNGAELDALGSAITKRLQIFDDGESPAMAASKLQFVGDEGSIDPTQQAKLAPDLYSAGHAVGARAAEIDAAVIVATKSIGRADVALTSTRNLFLKLADMRKAGVVAAEHFDGQLAELSKLDPLVLKDLVDTENFATTSVLVRKRDEVRSQAAAVDAVPADYVAQKVRLQGAVPLMSAAELIRAGKQGELNDRAALSPADATGVIASTYASRGQSPALSPFFRSVFAFADTKAYEWVGSVSESLWSGTAKTIQDLQRAGKPDAAEAAKLTLGRVTDTKFRDNNTGEEFFTDERHAAEFRTLRTQGYDLDAAGMTRYLTLKQMGRRQAVDQFLAARLKQPGGVWDDLAAPAGALQEMVGAGVRRATADAGTPDGLAGMPDMIAKALTAAMAPAVAAMQKSADAMLANAGRGTRRPDANF